MIFFIEAPNDRVYYERLPGLLLNPLWLKSSLDPRFSGDQLPIKRSIAENFAVFNHLHGSV
jgi:hypothetical protein